jgi:hypothetical protein
MDVTNIWKYRVFRAQADWTFILTIRVSCERATPLAEKNFAARHHVLRSLISLHNEHSISVRIGCKWENKIKELEA